jgi:hypothetical protein
MLEKDIEQKQCAHYWIIDSPNGRTSTGVCKFCGTVNEFSNDFGDILKHKKPPADSDNMQRDILSEP